MSGVDHKDQEKKLQNKDLGPLCPQKIAQEKSKFPTLFSIKGRITALADTINKLPTEWKPTFLYSRVALTEAKTSIDAIINILRNPDTINGETLITIRKHLGKISNLQLPSTSVTEMAAICQRLEEISNSQKKV